MKLTFYAADKPRERTLAESMKAGCAQHGDELVIKPLTVFSDDGEAQYHDIEPDTSNDVICIVGVKGYSKQILASHWKAGIHTLYFDKGYTRGRTISGGVKGHAHWRISVNSFQPLHYFRKIKRPGDRWAKVGFKIKTIDPKPGGHIVYAGSSQKYCDWHNLGDCTGYARKLIKRARKLIPRRKIIYRPKPSWKDAVPIDGTVFSRAPRSINDELQGASVLITHGSNAALDALRMGVPAITLGDAIVSPLCSRSVDQIKNPKLPTKADLTQLCYDLAYCQWTTHEMYNGKAWANLKEVILT